MNTLKQLSKVIIFFLAIVFFLGAGVFAVQRTDWDAVITWIENAPEPGYYRVVSFADGDTIVVDMNGVEERVRFIGVDTPEKNHPEKAVQCFAEAASQFTKELIGSNDVRLEADPSNDNRDRYDRLLRYIFLEDGTLVNQEIIEQGYGFAYLGFPFERQADFAQSERNAEQNDRGLWSDCDVDLSGRQPQTNSLQSSE